MPYELAGARLKWDRANEQAGELSAEIGAFLNDERNRYKLALDRDTDTPEERVIIRFDRATPDVWSVRIGEIVHNWRSALDHMVYEIAAAEGEGKVPMGTEFPIFLDRAQFASKNRGGGLYKIRGLPEPARTSIEEIQPFNRDDSPERHRLWALQELSNWDKHRLLHLTNLAAAVRNLRVEPWPGITIDAVSVRADGEIEDGGVLATYRVSGVATDGAQVLVDAQIVTDIAFEKTGPAGGFIVAKGLHDLIEVVGMVAGRLRNLP